MFPEDIIKDNEHGMVPISSEPNPDEINIETQKTILSHDICEYGEVFGGFTKLVENFWKETYKSLEEYKKRKLYPGNTYCLHDVIRKIKHDGKLQLL